MSELIAPELVLLDENLGDSRFDVIERLAHTIVKAERANDFDQLYADAKARDPRPTPASPAVSPFPTAEARRSPNPPSRWHAPTPA